MKWSLRSYQPIVSEFASKRGILVEGAYTLESVGIEANECANKCAQ